MRERSRATRSKIVSMGSLPSMRAMAAIQPQVKEMQDAATARISEAHKNVKSGAFKPEDDAARVGVTEPAPVTKVDKGRLLRWSDAVIAAPEGFVPNKKLAAQFAKRQQTLKESGDRLGLTLQNVRHPSSSRAALCRDVTADHLTPAGASNASNYGDLNRALGPVRQGRAGEQT